MFLCTKFDTKVFFKIVFWCASHRVGILQVYLRSKDNSTVKIWTKRIKSHTARAKLHVIIEWIVHDLFSKFDAQNLPYPTIWKMTIEKWVRLCMSCGNNVQFTPIKSSPNCFTSFAQCHQQNVIKIWCIQNTLVWLFYGLETENDDGSLNCVRRCKVQTKDHFKWNSISEPFDKWCVCVSSFRFTMHSKQ